MIPLSTNLPEVIRRSLSAGVQPDKLLQRYRADCRTTEELAAVQTAIAAASLFSQYRASVDMRMIAQMAVATYQSTRNREQIEESLRPVLSAPDFDILTQVLDEAEARIAPTRQQIRVDLMALAEVAQTQGIETAERLTWACQNPVLRGMRLQALEWLRERVALPQVSTDKNCLPIAESQAQQQVSTDNIQPVPIERVFESANGWIVSGNSGAGKSSSALKLAALLTAQQPHKVIVLDPHARKNSWAQYGLTALSDYRQIEAVLRWSLKELEQRQSEDREPILIIWDEIPSCLLRIDKQLCKDALLCIGSEGRKFGLPLIALTQSENVEALGIDRKFRNNFGLLLLCASARAHAEKWKQQDSRFQWVQQTAYPAIASGCVPESLVFHPTHSHHTVFKPSGNPPAQIPPIRQLSGVQPVETEAESESEQYDPEWESDLQLLKQAEGKVTKFAQLKYGATGGAKFWQAKKRVEELREYGA